MAEIALQTSLTGTSDLMDKSAAPDNPQDRTWDAIVIGTGMGGGVLGHALAKAGRTVLFCEKGKSHLHGADSLQGDYAEHFAERREHAHLNDSELLARAGRSGEAIADVSGPRRYNFVPFIGLGTGGSSALYGMVLERFFPVDFSPKRNFPHARGNSLPEQWPITYDDLGPYYEAAEQLFRVRGTADPLRGNLSTAHLLPPPELSAGARELHDFLHAKGLHPYRVPLACEFVSGCECCQSYLCSEDCKNDSARICLQPALTEFGAQLLSECDVSRLEASDSAVTGVVCEYQGRQVTLRGKVVVLAAGALESPRILLNSASAAWPDGLANESGMVGRNLMRHFVDLYPIKPKAPGPVPTSLKEIAFNDYHAVGAHKCGTVQSFGEMPPPALLLKGLEQDLRKGRFPLAAALFKLVKPVLKPILRRLFSGRLVLATIMEDLPYADNRLTLSDHPDALGRRQLILSYRIPPADRDRIQVLRQTMSEMLKPYSFMLIKQAENNERIVHACGTCRFGDNPQDSVLDVNNRAHGLSNLYVVDASFFPSSGGSNPALTIAANALRVADHLTKDGPNNGKACTP